MNVTLVFEYDTRPTMGAGRCLVILRPTLIAPGKGAICCQWFRRAPAAGLAGHRACCRAGAACGVLQPKGRCSGQAQHGPGTLAACDQLLGLTGSRE